MIFYYKVRSVILETLQRLSPLALIPALVGSALLVSACERIEPQPESGILLQAIGKFEADGHSAAATLSLERGDSGSLLLAVRSQGESPARILAEGELAERIWDQVLLGTDGPLVTSVEGPVARITQTGTVTRPLASVTSLAAPDANQGTLELQATRWALYHVGILEHGLEGRVTLVLKKSDGAKAGTFTGITSLKRGGYSRVAVGARIPGKLTGASELGAGSVFNEVDAVAVLSFPTGAGAMEVGGMRQAFTFNPETDLSPKGGSGALKLEQNDVDEVILRDDFKVDLDLRNVALGLGKKASGKAHAQFSVQLVVNHRQIVVSGTTQGSAELKNAEGKGASFDAPASDVQTLLDW
jgi:hypothetical protein